MRKAIIVELRTLALAINIVLTDVLSARTPLQQFGFDQPNIIVEYFRLIGCQAWLSLFCYFLIL